MNKRNWKERWSKLKNFVKTAQRPGDWSGKNSHRGQQACSGKAEIFNVIMAMYAGEEHNQVFRELKIMADRYPVEVEFYVPQLCTYLFHFTTDGDRESFQLLDAKPEGPGITSDEESKSVPTASSSERQLLKDFLLDRSRKSTQFAHLVFWYLMAGIDDSESIQMSQHNNCELWAFLNELVSTCEASLT